MLDHVGLNVKDFERSKAFYVPALEPLGVEVIMQFQEFMGMGTDQKPWFWIGRRDPVTTGTHVAFASPNRTGVDKFYEAAIAAGGTDNGAPGLRDIYHPNYYGAFVLDPDGNNVEAVCHT